MKKILVALILVLSFMTVITGCPSKTADTPVESQTTLEKSG